MTATAVSPGSPCARHDVAVLLAAIEAAATLDELLELRLAVCSAPAGIHVLTRAYGRRRQQLTRPPRGGGRG